MTSRMDQTTPTPVTSRRQMLLEGSGQKVDGSSRNGRELNTVQLHTYTTPSGWFTHLLLQAISQLRDFCSVYFRGFFNPALNVLVQALHNFFCSGLWRGTQLQNVSGMLWALQLYVGCGFISRSELLHVALSVMHKYWDEIVYSHSVSITFSNTWLRGLDHLCKNKKKI